MRAGMRRGLRRGVLPGDGAVTRSELAAALRAAFLSASGHQDGWDAVAEKAEEIFVARITPEVERQVRRVATNIAEDALRREEAEVIVAEGVLDSFQCGVVDDAKVPMVWMLRGRYGLVRHLSGRRVRFVVQEVTRPQTPPTIQEESTSDET